MKTSDGQSQEDSKTSLHNLSLQTDKEADKRDESCMSIALPLVKQIDQWLSLEKQSK